MRNLIQSIIRNQAKTDFICDNFTLKTLASATKYELNLTEIEFSRLASGIEIGRQIEEAKADYSSPKKISCSQDAVEKCCRMFHRLMLDGVQEEMHILTLSTKNVVIDSHMITKGILDAALAHPREIFRAAIKDSASSIILVHNHPSGDPTPSDEDIQITDRLTEVGKTVGIDVLDHIVLGRNSGVSIREYV